MSPLTAAAHGSLVHRQHDCTRQTRNPGARTFSPLLARRARASTSSAVEQVLWVLVRGGGQSDTARLEVLHRMRAGETGNRGHGDLRRCPAPANWHGCDRWKMNVCTVPVLEAKVRRINTWQLKTDSYYRIHMMSDGLNLGSQKAPMFLESTLMQRMRRGN